MSRGHQHIGTGTQNQGNSLGDRPCVRQSKMYREREGGHDMKNLLGNGNLNWNVNKLEGAYSGMAAHVPVVPRRTMSVGAVPKPSTPREYNIEITIAHENGRPPAARFHHLLHLPVESVRVRCSLCAHRTVAHENTTVCSLAHFTQEDIPMANSEASVTRWSARSVSITRSHMRGNSFCRR